MQLYDTLALEKQIEYIAEQNMGEVPEELLQELIEQQTQSLVQVENLIKYIKTIEYKIDACKKEEERIKNLRDKAEKHIERIKTYLTPYVKSQGKVETDTFKLSIRKSKSVNIINEQSIPFKYFDTIPEILKVNKNLIKTAIENNNKVPGAELKENDNLQIK